MKLLLLTLLAMLAVSARAMPEPAPEPESEPEPPVKMAALINADSMEMTLMKVEMCMNVMKMMVDKMNEAKPTLEAIYNDGPSPELAMQLLTIHQAAEKDFQTITGMPFPMAVFGEQGTQNLKMKEMMMMKATKVLKMMMDRFSEKKKILDAINADGATPELAMQLLTASQETAKSFMKMTGMLPPMMLLARVAKGKKMEFIMKEMKMGMEVARMTLGKMQEMQQVMKTVMRDGDLSPEMALKLLMIKEDISTRYTEITGEPCYMTMMGETGLENIKALGMMLTHMEKGTDLSKMMLAKSMEENKILRALNKDGPNAELALQLLTNKEDMSTIFTNITGMPCPMTVMGEAGLNNIRQSEKTVMHMEKGVDVAGMIVDKLGQSKMVMEVINKEGATPARAMQLADHMREMGASFVEMYSMPSPMMMLEQGVETN